jgi:hypothetical protein
LKKGKSGAFKSLLLTQKLKEKFDLFRDQNLPVHDYILVEWINKLKLDLEIKNLDLTSKSVIQKFKQDNGIVGRRITKFVTRRKKLDQDKLFKDANDC